MIAIARGAGRAALLALVLVASLPLAAARAAPIRFNIPAQPASEALIEFSRQTGDDVLYPFDALQAVTSTAVTGELTASDALARLLEGTGFTARRNLRGKFVVRPEGRPSRERRRGSDGEPEVLDPYVVEGRFAGLRPLGRSRLSSSLRTAAGNLDLPRSESDALAFTIYDRDQIARSGVVNLNEFLQRQLLESDVVSRPPEQNSNEPSYLAGSTNLNLRGFGGDETVILVNGRRMPEIITSGGNSAVPPDVNLIPLSLVQQVQVLPSSASALYSGNPVGGVINIVLRPDADATELTTTYTNALSGFDAPQTSISLQHGQSFLDGRLRARFSATFTRTVPPTEAELDYRGARPWNPPVGEPIFRATPNIRTPDLSPLFAAGTAAVTSVAPGSTGAGGLGAFAGREGVRNLDYFDSVAGFAVAPGNSVDHPFGRRQERGAYFGSINYDVTPWLQLGADVLHARTTVHRGLDVFAGDVALSAGSPLNPFGRDILVSLNETAPRLGENYNEARLQFSSAVVGAMLKLPADWRIAGDLQYAQNLAKYRAVGGVDSDRWQALVDAGIYQPLRDTQRLEPPAEFYDRVLLYRDGRGAFVTLGDFETIDAAARITNQSLALPTGVGAVNAGVDYRSSTLAAHREQLRYGDGSIAGEEIRWSGRTLERLSVFGELQAPVLPRKWRPRFVQSIDGDLALRSIMADSDRESTFAPTYALKVVFTNGLMLRGSVTTSNRFPTPQMSRPMSASGGPGTGVEGVCIRDPLRNETYAVLINEAFNPDVIPEEAITQTAGFVFERGEHQRVRAAVDFVDTRKSNEIVWLEPQTVVSLESVFPGRLVRRPVEPGDTQPVGRVTSVMIGSANASWRRSQHVTASFDFAREDVLGGTLETHARVAYFHRYDQQLFANSPVVDQLRNPDGVASKLLQYRANFGATWSNSRCAFGLDGQYFHSRRLPSNERVEQGRADIRPYWQLDAYLQVDVARFLPANLSPRGMRAQLRVNNLSGFDYPKYAADTSGAGVQPYGDWRGRTYSLSVTTAF